MKFLKEITEQVELEILTEAEGGKKSYYITGIFMQGNMANRNGRVYPTKTLVNEVARYKKEYIDTKRSLGELNHPESVSVNPKEASHIITELWVDGNNIMGKAKILDTPNGKIVKALMDEGIRLGVSSRGFGSLKEVNGSKEVQEDYHLATVDIVQDPSAPHAFVRGIMEHKEFIIEDGMVKEIEEIIVKEEPKKINEADLLERFAKLIDAPNKVNENSDNVDNHNFRLNKIKEYVKKHDDALAAGKHKEVKDHLSQIKFHAEHL